MNKKEFKRHLAYEALVILGVLALLLFICRLWPILLLVILGIFIAVVRLLFLSAKKVEIIEPLPQLAKPAEPTEKDVEELAYSTIQRRITELVLADYPDARWVWRTPNARENILNGEMVYILLGRAGGYRQAQVLVQNLRVCGLAFQSAPDTAVQDMPDTQEDDEEQAPEQPQNFEYLAFEWVDAHAVELNERCNESIAQGFSSLLLDADELPAPESWPDICRELDRNGIENCECAENGIQIHLTQ